MGFLVFLVLLLPAVLLCALVKTLLSPFSGALQPFWDWISQPAVF